MERLSACDCEAATPPPFLGRVRRSTCFASKRWPSLQTLAQYQAKVEARVPEPRLTPPPHGDSLLLWEHEAASGGIGVLVPKAAERGTTVKISGNYVIEFYGNTESFS